MGRYGKNMRDCCDSNAQRGQAHIKGCPSKEAALEAKALDLAREAVAQFEEAYGHDKSLPGQIRAGRKDGYERVQCAKSAALAALEETVQ